jgi:hypothetical protein
VPTYASVPLEPAAAPPVLVDWSPASMRGRNRSSSCGHSNRTRLAPSRRVPLTRHWHRTARRHWSPSSSAYRGRLFARQAAPRTRRRRLTCRCRSEEQEVLRAASAARLVQTRLEHADGIRHPARWYRQDNAAHELRPCDRGFGALRRHLCARETTTGARASWRSWSARQSMSLRASCRAS